MSATQVNDLKLQLEECLVGHCSFIALSLKEGKFEGRRQNGQYVYEYVPKAGANSSEVVRVIFKEKVDLKSIDTAESAQEKFVRVDSVYLPLTDNESNRPLPVGWSFFVKTPDSTSEEPSPSVEFITNDDDDKESIPFQMIITLPTVDIVAYGSDNRMVPIKLDSPTPAIVALLMLMTNLD